MPPDIEKYRRYVDHFDISEDKKIDLIHTVYRIMESFVDRAFGIDPTQQSLAIKPPKVRKTDAKMIDYEHSETSESQAKQIKKVR